jgi:hypothetical protein
MIFCITDGMLDGEEDEVLTDRRVMRDGETSM